MSDIDRQLQSILQAFPPGLSEAITGASTVAEFKEGTSLVTTGQYIKVIPLVISGLIKVSTNHLDKELLLYYISAAESCVMSFSAGLENAPSKISAITDEDTIALLMPVSSVRQWVKDYPSFNRLYFEQFNHRYNDLLGTIHELLFNKMDTRLQDYLKQKVLLTGRNTIKLSHRQIAQDLGTAREVVSRVMKKLEQDGIVLQSGSTITYLGL